MKLTSPLKESDGMPNKRTGYEIVSNLVSNLLSDSSQLSAEVFPKLVFVFGGVSHEFELYSVPLGHENLGLGLCNRHLCFEVPLNANNLFMPLQNLPFDFNQFQDNCVSVEALMHQDVRLHCVAGLKHRRLPLSCLFRALA